MREKMREKVNSVGNENQEEKGKEKQRMERKEKLSR